ncbi:MAG: hypothetical protein PHV54_11290 [Tolumonas sp.]|nr:hypothetical protein [Tolumonas sp.]
MRNTALLKTIFIAILLSGCATTDKNIANNSDSSENLIQSTPFGYVTTTKNYIPSKLKETTMLPEHQSEENWTERLLTQVYFDKKNISPDEYNIKLKESWKTNCPNISTEYHTSVKENGYPVSVLMLKCPDNNPKTNPAILIIKTIQGRNALYSIQQSFRNDVSQAKISKYSRNFRFTFLCSKDAEIKCPNFVKNN